MTTLGHLNQDNSRGREQVSGSQRPAAAGEQVSEQTLRVTDGSVLGVCGGVRGGHDCLCLSEGRTAHVPKVNSTSGNPTLPARGGDWAGRGYFLVPLKHTRTIQTLVVSVSFRSWVITSLEFEVGMVLDIHVAVRCKWD